MRSYIKVYQRLDRVAGDREDGWVWTDTPDQNDSGQYVALVRATHEDLVIAMNWFSNLGPLRSCDLSGNVIVGSPTLHGFLFPTVSGIVNILNYEDHPKN